MPDYAVIVIACLSLCLAATRPGRSLGKRLAVQVAPGGGLQVVVGAERYLLATALSYPGEKIGWHTLGQDQPAPGDWQPRLRHHADGSVTVTVRAAQYRLCRRLHPSGHRMVVEDTLTNTGRQDVGIIYRHTLTAGGPWAECLLGGADQTETHLAAENPSVYVRRDQSGLGWLAEDAVLRLQLHLAADRHSVTMAAERFALRPGKSHTFRWALYPQTGQGDYWAFVNRVRRDWGVNHPLRGPWTIFDVTSQMGLLCDEAALRHYLARNRVQVVALAPWVDYENYNAATGRPINRAEAKPLLQEAMAAIKRVDPTIICIGMIEGNLVGLPQEIREALLPTIGDAPQEQYAFTAEQMALLRAHRLPWQDCLLQSRDGLYRYELYYRGNHYPMLAIAVYAAPGNDQHRYWLDQARFLLEEVGLEGLYVDQFNMAFNDDQRYSFDRWDGTTVDIDPATGDITARYTDGGLVSPGAARSLAEYVLSRGRYMLANTYPAEPQMQALPVHRFTECEWAFDLFSWNDGEQPPLDPYPCQGHFSTPIALGVRPARYGEQGQAHYTRLIMKAAIAYLRHGLLYYHYYTDLPPSGPGAGEYGALNHMFPFTPVALHAGWVVGRERTVTCVSGCYRWAAARRPRVLVFDMEGKEVTPRAVMRPAGRGWQVELTLQDWAQIGVIE